METSSSGRAFDAALVEFAALRELMATRYQMRTALLAGALTAIGIVAGLALDRGDSRNLLLLIPVLASAVAIIDSELGRRNYMIGRYIHTRLWPYLQRLDASLPAWETYWREHSRIAMVVVSDVQAPVLMFAISALALAARVHDAASDASDTALWWFGAGFTMVTCIYVAATVRMIVTSE